MGHIVGIPSARTYRLPTLHNASHKVLSESFNKLMHTDTEYKEPPKRKGGGTGCEENKISLIFKHSLSCTE